MDQPRETAGSLLAKLLQARKSGTSADDAQALEQQLGEQMHRQLQCPNTAVTVTIGDRVIAKPEE